MNSYLILGAIGACCVAACHSEPMNVVTAHEAGRGTTAVYDAPVDQVWAAAHVAIKWSEVGKPEDHQDQGYVITDPAAADQVGIWLSAEGNRTRAKILVMDDPGLPGPFESQVKKDIGTALGLMAEGKPVDKRP